MKQLIIKSCISLSLVFLSACSTSSDVSPSQNDTLNSISNSSSKSEKGAMQGILDNFLNNEWSDTMENDEEIQEKYMEEVKVENNTTKETDIKHVDKKDKHFTLQEYADKRAAYVKAHPADHNNSHVHKLETMPVLGSTRKR